MSLEFGSYVQLFEDNNPSNTLHSRTLGAIALRPTGNANGDYAFLSLATGRRITRRSWTELPIPDTAIARVEALALLEGQPLIQQHGLVVEWRPDFPIDEDEYDRDYHARDLADIPMADNLIPIDDTELTDLHALHPLDPLVDPPVRHVDNQQGADEDQNNVQNNEPNILEEPGAHNNIPEETGAHNEENNMNEPDEPDDIPPVDEEGDENANDAIDTSTTNRYNLRPRAADAINARERFAVAMDDPHDGQSYFPPVQLLQGGNIVTAERHDAGVSSGTVRKVIFAHVLTQMSERKGLQKHGVAAEEALLREFHQLNDLSVFEPKHARDLTKAERQGALRALNLIKEKGTDP